MSNLQEISARNIKIALSWCLAWGNQRQPQFDLTILEKMREALFQNKQLPKQVQTLVQQVETLQELVFPDNIEQLSRDYSELWQQTTKIGLVYGGATKIKQYVFENINLTDIRGASAFLDRINIIDIPAFFKAETSSNFPQCQKAAKFCQSVRQELTPYFPELWGALIPELIIYSTGGNVLAFCPAAFVDKLANAIERRYTEETLTANSCAVGETFKLLEFRFGLLPDNMQDAFWLDKYRQANSETDLEKRELVSAYFGALDNDEKFKSRKSFNELTTKLAILFNQRRSGNDVPNRPTRRYPPMFETHPYLRRDEGERRSAIIKADELPSEPYFSEPLARQHLVGQIAKHDEEQHWYQKANLNWQPGKIPSWVDKFEQYLKDNSLIERYGLDHQELESARTLRELGDVYQGFVAYIYADGNNMGSYIQKITTPEQYQQFSQDIFKATEESVYQALAEHLHPHKLHDLTDLDNKNRNGKWIHPFEILTIGGDDVMLIVPANKALQIAKTIGEDFERRLAKTGRYPISKDSQQTFVHRYEGKTFQPVKSSLSMSIGVLITAKDTPIHYAENLTNQLLKSAKKRAKELKNNGYYGGTIYFLTLKSVTMISSNIEQFRQEALIKTLGAKLKLYAAPYTFYELEGLIEVVKALKNTDFPKSQLYQIRSLLEKGKHISILNYRYFRSKLQESKSELIQKSFEDPWCKAKTNEGNIAPWMYELKDHIYETIWREIVDIYDFIEVSSPNSTPEQQLTAKEINR
ncbi:type III-B CRISPR-associated protein Cas10/Cmr2 [Aphanothece hegewaldii CCALA 016]|uniref:Type III-B CRISPR-associated protein Cas10/Cmr2 n=1 Tax=Aphanothece hegewaldii CCALA 016 TaxID=2107694 RepID=A0A2T1LYB3_9CHRO|nr:type III-B CRISPR-associated protein Cas10/Cmr2 [Aphanothece hegewaldii]PSF37380.1 type III-B CRISPR-associated protein Cas10/Cmr2 [Aphanothece hegewaldii CCALA 016]